MMGAWKGNGFGYPHARAVHAARAVDNAGSGWL